MLQVPVGIAFGAGVAVLLAWCLVGPFVKCVERQAAQPLRIENGKDIWTDGPDAAVWDFVMARGGSGPYVGAVEVLVFFVGIWVEDGWPIVASWLAFKVASKWKSWSEVSELPKPPPSYDDIGAREYALLRHKWLARRGATFMAGTGANILIAAFAVAMGNIVVRYG